MFTIPLGEDARLEPLEPWRAAEFLEHMNRGREFIGQHLTMPDAVTDLESSREYLADYARKAAADTGRIYGIRLADRLVGGVLFRTMDVERGHAEAGCWLEPAAAGRSLATRAARVIIGWAIEQRGIHRVEWRVAARNEPSIAVARRLGMTREGVLRELYPHQGQRLDVEIWSVLAHEWTASR
ncbi:GNAT family protein [Amycolatopsis endophytica]|uniref:RimJ/RimL family protein N-acetyltransferase n=1 Tax=Amycolatopsis endophytica TaxID=860233 RepID=A0A853BBI1_9PSEU|nr:GNAT family protein [Amycolatopsis endophytica]NYI92539.1 RimJ/RimL family protein N-acetyltransferase [Amycolatopsis endophytica]